MADGKNTTGFMPRRVKLNWAPSSFSLQVLAKNSKLELEKIWEAKEKERLASLVDYPANSTDIPNDKKVA